MTDKEIKNLGEDFEKLLRSMGIKNIKDIPKDSKIMEEPKEVWIIK